MLSKWFGQNTKIKVSKVSYVSSFTLSPEIFLLLCPQENVWRSKTVICYTDRQTECVSKVWCEWRTTSHTAAVWKRTGITLLCVWVCLRGCMCQYMSKCCVCVECVCVECVRVWSVCVCLSAYLSWCYLPATISSQCGPEVEDQAEITVWKQWIF